MAKVIRSFSLTPELAEALDKIPNRSAWLRNVLSDLLLKPHHERTIITVADVEKMINTKLQQLTTTNILENSNNYHRDDFIDIGSELDAMLSLASSQGVRDEKEEQEQQAKTS